MDKPTVLVADDDSEESRLIVASLTEAGMRALSASGAEALADQIDRHRSPILLADARVLSRLDRQEIRDPQLRAGLYTIQLLDNGAQPAVGADDLLRRPLDRCHLLARTRSGLRIVELTQQLHQVATIDGLTGLATRRTLHEGLVREWERSVRYGIPLSCVMLDIDFFKRINDTLGHAAGDDVLRRLGRVVLQNTRSSDIAGRYGGEEFCVVLPETTETQAAAWADRIRKEIAALEFKQGNETLRVTSSFGVAERLADMCSPDQLVDQADQALLVAKRSGRDRVVACRSLVSSAPSGSSEDPVEILRSVSAYAVMKSIVAPLQEDDTIANASNYFLRLRIGALPVVDRDGLLSGILSEKDVLAVMLSKGWWSKKVSEAMKRNVVCYDEQTPALTIYDFLSRVTIRSVVIVSRSRPTGVISRGSFLRFFVNSLAVNRTGIYPEVDATELALRARSCLVPPHDRISQAVRQMAAEAADLEERMAHEPADLVPCVVGGASRVQELVNDLLALSRFVRDQQASCELDASSQASAM